MTAHVSLVLFVTLLAALALWGWGTLAARLARVRRPPPPVAAAVGLGAVLFVGGLLNAAHLARPLALDAVGVGGLLLAGAGLRGRPLRLRADRAGLLVALPLAAVAVFAAATLAPPHVFNHFDDFEKYFAQPVRMLATGTVSGNPLSSAGSETLGGQALLQAFVLAHAPIASAAGVDVLFGLPLCLALAGFGRRSPGGALPALVAVVCVALVNPQVVNVTSLYTGAACIAALVLLGAADEGADAAPPAALFGLLYAALVALKTLFAPFVAVHALTAAAARWTGGGRPRDALRALLKSAGWTIAFLAPWIAMYVPLYLQRGTAGPAPPPRAFREPLALLSAQPLLYGSTQLHYTLLAIGAAALGLHALRLASRRPPGAAAGPLRGAATGLLAGGASYLAFMAILAPWVLGREHTTRYCAPLLIGTVPVALRLLAEWSAAAGALRERALALGLGAALAAAFLPSAAARARLAARHGSVVAYLTEENASGFEGYCAAALDPAAQRKMLNIQALVPRGEPIVAWVSTPFWLDFQRNPVLETYPAGLGTPWARVPASGYFLWEYKGSGVRTRDMHLAKLFNGAPVERAYTVRALAFIGRLGTQAQTADVLYDDGGTALVHVAEPSSATPSITSLRRRNDGR